MRGIAFDQHVAIGGLRPDGVACVDIGAGLVVLVNLIDGTKTRALDSDYVERVYGPFAEIDPSPALRARVQMLLDAPGSVAADQIPKTVTLDTPQMSRQELVELLDAANLQDLLPPEPTGLPDDQFIENCLNSLVPQMQSAGVDVCDPQVFCTSLFLQRTGLMPYGMTTEAQTPPAEMPMPPAPEEAAPPMADVTMPPPPLYSDQQPDATVLAEPVAVAAGSDTPKATAIGKPNKVKTPLVQPAGKPNA